MARPAKLHADGTVCLEGTRRVPRGFQPCCKEFAAHTVACVYDIRYEWWSRMKAWVTAISESAGSGGIVISFCPHCGRRLRGSGKNGRWLEVRR